MPNLGRRVVVTGANRGIGLATALAAAGAGFEVVGTVRDEEAAATLGAAAVESGVVVRVAELEVTDEASCRALIEREQPWGLVNNAGYAQSGAMADVTDDEAREQLEVLVLGPARLSRLAVGPMRAAGGGRIVNISSIAAEVSSPLLGWYQAAKSALEAISDATRMELEGDGIDVVLIQPGVVRTGIWADARERLDRDGATPGRAERAWQGISARLEPHMTSPDAVGRAVVGALTSERPRDRYPVGLDAQVMSRTAQLLPVAVSDRLTRALFRLR